MKLRIFYLLIPFLFSGCAQFPKKAVQKNSSWENQQTQLERLTHWSISGKLAIITPEERNSLNIHWQQSNQDFHIHLTTFLGLSVLDIQKSGDTTVIIDTDGNRHISDSTEQLITELSGMILPINQLQQWIKGNPSKANYQLDENQQVITLQSSSDESGLWSILYSDYRTTHNTNLPHKLKLNRGKLRIKFAISDWNIPDLQ
ncbi:MAG: outer membrane lipoprotein LolB [Psychromonas sp.]|nr:outer membrane lipoprotein LolB [Alteromonadales bacterium]MCP5078293.1 outer membrane lipoprotein LolB [Psychromonas sp.]